MACPDRLAVCIMVSKPWDDFFTWLNSINIELDLLSSVDVIIGIWKCKEDFEILDHIIFISKQCL